LSSETLARPYARAIFEHSEGLLEELGQVVNVIHQPNVTTLIDLASSTIWAALWFA